MKTAIAPWLCLACVASLLAGCGHAKEALVAMATPSPRPATVAAEPPPTATPAPTATSAPRPEPVQTTAPSALALERPLLTPVATGASIRLGAWSADGDWIAYWRAAAFDPAKVRWYPAGTLHLQNLRTGEMCSYPQLETTSYGLPIAWRGGNRILVYDWNTTWTGEPCRGPLTPTTETIECCQLGPYLGYPPDPVAASPGGSYQVGKREQWPDSGGVQVTTLFTRTATGERAAAVEYLDQDVEGRSLLGGEWITDDLFLVYYSVDRGPLLVDLAHGRVVEVVPELFGIHEALPAEVWYYARGAAVAGTNTYHLVLATAGMEAGRPPLRLYHSESGVVEQLTSFRDLSGPPSSPDGRWVVLRGRPAEGTAGADSPTDEYALSTRPVDPPGSRAHLAAEGVCCGLLSPDGTRLAMAGASNSFRLYSFPEGKLLGTWDTGLYHTFPCAWSPDGRLLAFCGNVPAERKDALFIVEP